jgi:Cu-processing system permease protein
MKTWAVTLDLLREARSRKWFLFLGGAITLGLLVLGLSLKLEVVDGALAASRFFGKSLDNPMMAADVALGAVFSVASQFIFYGGMHFGIFSCSDFAPKLLSPGRIEHLLALPVRRWELLAGTFLGVLILALAGAVYGSVGLTLIFGVKAGVWTVRPLLSAMLAVVGFVPVYATMLTAAVFARSAALSSGIGGVVFALGVVTSFRDTLLPMFSPGLGRFSFNLLTVLMPRLERLAELAGQLAGAKPVSATLALSLVGGCFAFGAGALAVGIWRFEERDF